MNKVNIRELIHSLRNPLTAILTNLELITGGYISKLDKESEEILNEIMFNARYMETIMRNVSDIIKIKSRDEIACRSIEIKNIFDNLISQLKAIIKDIHEVDIKIKGNPKIVAEPDMINRFFAIILFELLKFTSPDNRLKIDISQESSILIIKLHFSDRIKSKIGADKIFNELFISPSQRQNKLTQAYIEKIAKLFNGKIKLLKDKIVYLKITFKKI